MSTSMKLATVLLHNKQTNLSFILLNTPDSQFTIRGASYDPCFILCNYKAPHLSSNIESRSTA